MRSILTVVLILIVTPTILANFGPAGPSLTLDCEPYWYAISEMKAINQYVWVAVDPIVSKIYHFNSTLYLLSESQSGLTVVDKFTMPHLCDTQGITIIDDSSIILMCQPDMYPIWYKFTTDGSAINMQHRVIAPETNIQMVSPIVESSIWTVFRTPDARIYRFDVNFFQFDTQYHYDIKPFIIGENLFAFPNKPASLVMNVNLPSVYNFSLVELDISNGNAQIVQSSNWSISSLYMGGLGDQKGFILHLYVNTTTYNTLLALTNVDYSTLTLGETFVFDRIRLLRPTLSVTITDKYVFVGAWQTNTPGGNSPTVMQMSYDSISQQVTGVAGWTAVSSADSVVGTVSDNYLYFFRSNYIYSYGYQ